MIEGSRPRIYDVVVQLLIGVELAVRARYLYLCKESSMLRSSGIFVLLVVQRGDDA